MNLKGIPVSRWIDGVLEDKDNIDQPDNVRAMVFWGHAPNSQTRMKEMKQAMEKLDLMVVVDPYPTVSAVLSDRTDGVYLLPATTQFETYGSVTASNRSLQWREKVIDPSFDSLPDHTIIYKFAKKLGFADRMFRNITINGDEPLIEDVTREFNSGMWTIGYTGQSPERLKLHMENQHTLTALHFRRLVDQLMATITVCHGHVGVQQIWAIPARLCCMIHLSLLQKVVCASVPVLAWNMKAIICWLRGHTLLVQKSRMAILSLIWPCLKNWAGTAI